MDTSGQWPSRRPRTSRQRLTRLWPMHVDQQRRRFQLSSPERVGQRCASPSSGRCVSRSQCCSCRIASSAIGDDTFPGIPASCNQERPRSSLIAARQFSKQARSASELRCGSGPSPKMPDKSAALRRTRRNTPSPTPRTCGRSLENPDYILDHRNRSGVVKIKPKSRDQQHVRHQRYDQRDPIGPNGRSFRMHQCCRRRHWLFGANSVRPPGLRIKALSVQCFSSSGTFPPFCASFCITCLWSQTFMAAELFVSPV